MHLIVSTFTILILASAASAQTYPLGDFSCPNGSQHIFVRISELAPGWRIMRAQTETTKEAWLIEGPVTRIKTFSKDDFYSDQLSIGGSTFKLNLLKNGEMTHPNDGRPCVRKD